MTYDENIYLRKFIADLGTPTGESGLQYKQDAYTGNAVTVAFTLTQTPSTSYPVLVYLAGILQTSSQVTIAGTTITFATAPGNGVAILAVYSY